MSRWNRRTFLTRAWRPALFLGVGLTSCLLWAISAVSAEPPWRDVYRDGFQIGHLTEGWQSPLTSSARTADGLRITDPSTAEGSGRFFHVDWGVEPQEGATVEVRLKTISCSEPWGVVLLVVYDRRQLDPDGNLRPEVVGTRVTVRRR